MWEGRLFGAVNDDLEWVWSHSNKPGDAQQPRCEIEQKAWDVGLKGLVQKQREGVHSLAEQRVHFQSDQKNSRDSAEWSSDCETVHRYPIPARTFSPCDFAGHL